MQNLDFLEYESIDTIEAVIERFENLDRALKKSKLRRLSNFNYTYLIITRNVNRAIYEGDFEYISFLRVFDCEFAKYYLRALDSYLKGNSTPPAWLKTFEVCEKNKISPLLAMALGVNAHVNNDISQTLNACKAGDNHFIDYIHVNDIIISSIYEVIDSLDNEGPIIGPKQMLLKPMYKETMARLIKKWRQDAWKSFLKLKIDETNISEIEKRAYKKAVRLTALLP